MQVFKTTLRIIRTKKSIFLYISLPLVMTLLYMSGSPKASSDFSPKPLTFTVQNFDQKNPLSQALLDVLSNTNTQVAYPTDPQVLRNKLFYMQIQYSLTIPENFFNDYAAYIAAGPKSGLKAPQLVRVESASSDAKQMNQMIERFLMATASKLIANPEADKAVLAKELVASLSTATPVHVVKNSQIWAYGATEFFFRFAAYGIMASLIYIVGFVYNAFRDKKVLSRQLASPTSFSQLNFGIASTLFLCALFIGLIYTLAAFQYFGQTLFSLVGLLAIANLFIFILVILSLGILLSTVMKSESSINVLGNVVPLALAFLGGTFVPTQYLSKPIQALANFLPTHWYNKSLDAFMQLTNTDFLSLTPILNNFLILASFGLTFAIASLGLSHFLNQSTGESMAVAKKY